MIFVQVILGGSAAILGLNVLYHLIWGMLTFVMLVVTTVLAARDFGTGSTLLKVGLAAVVDFVGPRNTRTVLLWSRPSTRRPSYQRLPTRNNHHLSDQFRRQRRQSFR